MCKQESVCTKEQVEKIMQVMVNKANSRYEPLEGHETSVYPLVLEVEWVTCEQESRWIGCTYPEYNQVYLVEDWFLHNDTAFAEQICAHEVAHVVQYMLLGYSSHDRQFKQIWDDLLDRPHSTKLLAYANIPKYYKWLTVCPHCGSTVGSKGKPRRKEVTCWLCKSKFNVQENLIENKMI